MVTADVGNVEIVRIIYAPALDAHAKCADAFELNCCSAQEQLGDYFTQGAKGAYCIWQADGRASGDFTAYFFGSYFLGGDGCGIPFSGSSGLLGVHFLF